MIPMSTLTEFLKMAFPTAVLIIVFFRALPTENFSARFTPVSAFLSQVVFVKSSLDVF